MSARRLTVVEAWVMLHACDVLLKLRGFKPTFDWARVASHRRGRHVTDANECARDVYLAVATARRWRFRISTETCLPTALAARRLLASRGVEARLVLGVRKYPFGAHAWIRSGDVTIDYPADHHKMFAAIEME